MNTGLVVYKDYSMALLQSLLVDPRPCWIYQTELGSIALAHHTSHNSKEPRFRDVGFNKAKFAEPDRP